MVARAVVTDYYSDAGQLIVKRIYFMLADIKNVSSAAVNAPEEIFFYQILRVRKLALTVFDVVKKPTPRAIMGNSILVFLMRFGCIGTVRSLPKSTEVHPYLRVDELIRTNEILSTTKLPSTTPNPTF